MSIRFLLLLALFQTLTFAQNNQACNNPLDTCDDDTNRFPNEKRITIKYANKTITKVEYSQNYVDIDFNFDTDTVLYRFVVCGCKAQQDDSRITISINPQSFYIGNGPSLALYHFLASDNIEPIKLVGKLENIFNPDIRDHVTDGGAVEASFLDPESGFPAVNYSKIAEVNPALSIIDTFGVNGYSAADIDVPFLVNAEAQEQNPLARAEWLKIIGLVIDQPEKANDEFAKIEKRYNDAKETAEGAIRRPAVFFNAPSTFTGNLTWTLPVTDEYIVQLIRDANADYRYIDEDPVAGESGNSFNISTVVQDFTSADYLLQSSQFPGSSNRTLGEYLTLIEKLDEPGGLRAEFEKLKTVRCANVWNRQKRLTEDGMADDFFESAIVRPDELLLDFIQALHPYLDFEGRETFYIYMYRDTANAANCPTTALVDPAPDGEEFVDTKFEVPGLDRYEIADRLEGSVIPEIKERVEEPFEVFFHHEDVSENVTVVTVRVQVNSTEKESFIEERSLISAMRESLGEDVKQRNEEESAPDQPDEGSDPETPTEDEDANKEDEDKDGGGLSGGAVAGIVIAVLAVVLVAGFVILKRRSKRRSPVPVEGFGGIDQDMTP